MNRTSKRSISKWGIAGGLIVLGLASYQLYKSISSSNRSIENSSESDRDKEKNYTSRPIAIILTDSIISSKLPLNEILKKTEDVVLVVVPGSSIDDLNEKLDKSVLYKVIECEGLNGVWSVIKHLKSETIFVVKDDLEEDPPEELERYVGDIIDMEQNFTLINETILSHIIC